MREASFQLPATWSPAYGETMIRARAELLATFGGYHHHTVQGYWKDANGRMYSETMNRYVVAAEPWPWLTGKANYEKLELIARAAAKDLGQQVLYIVDFHGTAHIIPLN